MNYRTGQKVREALRYGDGSLLAEAVEGDRFLNYDELEEFVQGEVGGYRHVSWRGIRIGETMVEDHYGRPRVTS